MHAAHFCAALFRRSSADFHDMRWKMDRDFPRRETQHRCCSSSQSSLAPPPSRCLPTSPTPAHCDNIIIAAAGVCRGFQPSALSYNPLSPNTPPPFSGRLQPRSPRAVRLSWLPRHPTGAFPAGDHDHRASTSTNRPHPPSSRPQATPPP